MVCNVVGGDVMEGLHHPMPLRKGGWEMCTGPKAWSGQHKRAAASGPGSLAPGHEGTQAQGAVVAVAQRPPGAQAVTHC